MSTQADERIQNSDTYLIGGDGFSDGFESVMPLPRESLPGGKVEVMDVEKDKLVCQASPVRSEAVPVEAAFDATSSLNPEEMPGCAEALSVQESTSVAPERRVAKLTTEGALARLECIAIGGTGPPAVLDDSIDGLEATHEVIKVICV